MSSRSRARQFAIQILYQHEFSGYQLEKVFDLFFQHQECDAATRTFTEELVDGVLEQGAQLDLDIRAYLRNWTLDRIAKCDHFILQLALFELTQLTETPWRVVVDEAVNLAQSFSGESSASFVNGVLHAWCSKNINEAEDSE